MTDAPAQSSSEPKLTDRIGVVLATVLGIGYSPVAPGTMGTAAAVPMVLAASALTMPVYLALCVAVTLVGIWASAGANRAFGEHDSGRIVIDEVAGYFWTMLLVDRSNPWLLLAGFVLFRITDMTKPPPARAIDRDMHGGAGVVLDDVVAGLWAMLALWGLSAGINHWN